MPVDKAKAKGVSASSFFDLKAELSKHEEGFARNKAAGKSNAIVGGVPRAEKKPTVWARQNKGVKARAVRDIELEAISRPTLEAARVALERKAKIYDKLKKGKTGGLSDKQYDALLVDFDQKQDADVYESDSDDVDESLVVLRAPEVDENDPIVEYEDEFGRMRTAPRSEVPRHLVPASGDGIPDEDEDVIIRNPVNHFPVYEPSAERIAEIAKEHSEENNPLGVHYDATQEVRAKGAGYYQFSGDEETRRVQMEELKSARQETEKTRQETGARDVKPGEIEGMWDGDGAEGTAVAKTRAMEKRRRELEERRKMVDAKRRKVRGEKEASPPVPTSSARRPGASEPYVLATVVTTDPFLTLDASAGTKSTARSGAPITSDADTFLAQLEQEIFRGKRQ